ncbi:MAG: hypothetical protein Q8M29_10785 [Bacteroidota bacterium]|nr:hypothetical protein [Bacteroidota bacterium]
MKKKIILVLIILIPSLIYFLFELSEVNFKKMAFYGPKTLDANGDTVYFSIPEKALEFNEVFLHKDTIGSINVYFTSPFNQSAKDKNKAFVAILLKSDSKTKLGGLLEFQKYKAQKIKDVPIMLVATNLLDLPDLDPSLSVYKTNYSKKYLRDTLGIKMDNFHMVFLKGTHFWGEPESKFNYKEYNSSYFNQKPIHVFDYFAVLVDKDRHIRGYYDPTYISEVKRMVEEYKHLVLKDEHANMQETNKIEQK